jgi:hypothetical protein
MLVDFIRRGISVQIDLLEAIMQFKGTANLIPMS